MIHVSKTSPAKLARRVNMPVLASRKSWHGLRMVSPDPDLSPVEYQEDAGNWGEIGVRPE